MLRRFAPFVLLFLALFVTASGFAQTTAQLVGTVTSDHAPLPGATVTISSPALQGARTTVTGASGDYNFGVLPPGAYTVTVDLQGLQTVRQTVTLRLAQTSRVDADLKVSSVSEAITVTAAASSVLETPQVSTSFDAATIERLPMGRNIQSRVLLAPGVNNDGPNNQIVINGAQSFDNLYLVNGVVVNDTIRGQPQAAVIEDAIQETTVLTGGISAEYGRFTGGVVNTITKSGGNEFSGSLRDNLNNDKWRLKTAFRDPVSNAGEADHISKITPVYEGTLGGRIVRDRLWFFLAGRKENSSISNQTVGLNLPYTTAGDQKRYEVKLTGNVTSRHTLVGSYLKVQDTQSGTKFGNIVDLASLRSVGNPIKLSALHYNGMLTSNLVVEGQWSKKDFSIIGGGAPLRDEVGGTLLRDISTGRRAWSPTFCGVCPPKLRNNKDWLAKGSYYLSTKSFGSHTLGTGYDEFHQLRNENNYQSGSDFRLFGDFIYSGGQVFLHLDPTKSGTTSRSHFEWDPLLGLSSTSDFATKSVYLNDRWSLNNHWNFNLGARYDKNEGHNQSGVATVNDSAISPRLGAIFDVKGDGKHRLSLNYGRYVTKIDQGPADSTSTGGRYATYQFQYLGPELNAPGTPAGQLIPTDQVIKAAFDWFHANGFTSNNSLIYQLSIPGLTEKIKGNLKSPHMDEITLGYGVQLNNNSVLRADIIHRKWDDFYVTTRNLSTGQATTPTGAKVDVGFIENSGAGLSRRYNALQLQGQTKLPLSILFGGNYTYAKLRGNVEGEEFNNATTTIGVNGTSGSNVYTLPQYPEYTSFAQNNPVGYLAADIRHRANLWLQYSPSVPFGRLDLAVLERFHSGAPYSAAAVVDVRQNANLANGVANPGYALPPTQVQYYIGGRGAYRLDNVSETGFNLSYSIPVSRANLFLKADLLNAFNQQRVDFAATGAGSVIEQRVRTRFNGAKFPDGTTAVAFNPFTDKPVEGVNYQFDKNFGKPTNKDAYQLPRLYRFAVGIRF